MKKTLTISFILMLQNIFAQIIPVVKNDSITEKKDTIRILNDVIIIGNVTSKYLKKQPNNIAIVEAAPFYNSNITGIELLKQVSGIKVKQDGGFGSRTDFFITGSTGKQVKFFIDGLPQDNLGETQLLSIIPIEQMERVEVYKGVLPVDLGADALGAAINIVTRKEKENYIDASYSIASFNTHKFNIGSKYFFTKKIFASIQANANYAANNYKIDGEVPNVFGNIEIKNLPRFHDQYKNYNTKLQIGLVDIKLADQLSLSIIKTESYRQLQNNLVMTQPYGNASFKESLLSGIVRYQKNNIVKKININALASFNKIDGLFIDTSKNIYNWEGIVVGRKFSGGEITSSGNLLNIKTDVVNTKITLSYAISPNIKLILSNTFQYFNRADNDTFAQRFYNGIDYFSTPSILKKSITGVGLEGNLFKTKLKYSTALKSFNCNLKGYEIDFTSLKTNEQSLNAIAYNIALAYQLSNKFLIKTSYEHAARLPENEEVFGDIIFVRPNPKINIEQSDNINLSTIYTSNKIEAEIGFFYRNVNNIIFLRSTQFSSKYVNLLSARVKGVEANAKYNLHKNIILNGNITFQDLRNQSTIDNSGLSSERYKNARLPNIPYLFMNGGIMYKKENAFTKNNNLQIWYNTSFTNEYFLYWEIDGARELKNRIPTQFLYYAGASYTLCNKKIALALEVNNLTNTVTYDNFKVQLPGRWYSFKIRFYQFNKHKK